MTVSLSEATAVIVVLSWTKGIIWIKSINQYCVDTASKRDEREQRDDGTSNNPEFFI